MADSFEGKIIVVTGAGGRLGQRLVQAFAARGATVAAVDLDGDSVPWPGGAEGRAFSANMTEESSVAGVFEEIVRSLGRPYAVVHTVGGWAGTPLLETSLADFRKLADMNLISTFLCFREAARHMKDHGGRLIAMASRQGADRGAGKQYAYSAAKAGVMRLVEAVADEFSGTGLTAHAVAPSTILFDESSREGVAAGDLVSIILYLCSEAGAALNGATLRAYG